MITIPDHYAALGIDPTADPEVIAAAYRALAKKFHPDTGAAAGTADAERFEAIQQAYEVLRRPETRRAYDLELLAATEAELQTHIASKRRLAVRGRGRAAAPLPDLGDIRPVPVTGPGGPGEKPAPHRRQATRMHFAIPLVLVLLLGGGAWLFLPRGPDASPRPSPSPPQVAAVTPAPQPQVAAAIPAPQPPQPAVIKPASPVAPSAVEPQTNSAAGQPVFGSTGAMEAADAPAAAATDVPAAALPPLPKARPAAAARQAQQQKPAQQPSKPRQQNLAAQRPPPARLVYENPPQYYPEQYYPEQYYPEPDGYPPPPPGLEPPGFGPEAYAPPGYDPGFNPGRGPYRLVIFERLPGRQATAWSAGALFKSAGKCTRQGVKAVLRRTYELDTYGGGTRVWYECQRLTQY
ncbi:MAG: J domain-containing protein [Aestuariivirga sp.]|uniref:J domain-containing protein n=1 Tax=Aestuariivirga sp. TaxID=2650926 RepID=UPI0025BEE9D8|nr:J domain-containing protein [Aestuariivirga sp.]MCA3560080.1 J domain-containing protein [Aestuariivirga sp.]